MSTRLTVAIPAYNAGPYLRETLQSLAAQQNDDFSVLLIDDGSRDDTLAIAQAFAAQWPRLRVLSQPNAGETATRNRALREIGSDYVAFLDADDLALPGRLSRQLAHLEAHPDVAACASGFRVFRGEAGGEHREERRRDTAAPSSAALRTTLLFRNPVLHSSVMLRMSAVRAHGFFYDEQFRVAQDYELWSRISARARFDTLTDVLVCYRRHAQQAIVTQASEIERLHLLISARNLAALGVRPDETELRRLVFPRRYASWSDLPMLLRRFGQLQRAALADGGYDAATLRRVRRRIVQEALKRSAS